MVLVVSLIAGAWVQGTGGPSTGGGFEGSGLGGSCGAQGAGIAACAPRAGCPRQPGGLLSLNGKQLVSALMALTALQVCVSRKSRWCWWCA